MITTNTGAKKLESSDNWREIFPDNQGAQGAHNASVGAHDAAISQLGQTINGTTNNSGHTINSGEYFIANGGKYKATASIPNGEPWASSADPVSDNDLIGALNSKLMKYFDYSFTNVTISEGAFARYGINTLQPGESSLIKRVSALVTNRPDVFAVLTADGRIYIRSGNNLTNETLTVRVFYIT